MIGTIMGQLSLDLFTEGPARSLARRLVEMFESDAVMLASEHFDASLQKMISELERRPYETSAGWESRSMQRARFNQDPERAAQQAIKTLRCARLKERIADKTEALRTASVEQEKKILEDLKQLLAERTRVCLSSNAILR